MNITLKLQELDDLTLAHTKPPVTAILRNKLHTLRDQMEAYIVAKERITLDLTELERNPAPPVANPPEADKPPLQQEVWKVLQYLFDNDQVCTVAELSAALRLKGNIVKHYCDSLIFHYLAVRSAIPNYDQRFDPVGDNSGFEISGKGREAIISRGS